MEKKYYLGLDVGGTKVEGAIAHLNSSTHSILVVSKKRIASIHDVELFTNSLIHLITDLLSEAKIKISDLSAIALGLPGSLDPKTNIMLNGNTRFLIGVDLLGELKKRLNTDIPIIAQNDANLFTLAEAWGGAGKIYGSQHKIEFKDQVSIGITLGTGVGGGLVALGKILNGAHGSAMEVGHIVLHPKGNACYCGQFGCAETYLSGTALNKIMDSKEIFDLAQKGDAQAKNILEDYRKNFLHFLSVLNNLFNPHYFVFGGGLSGQKILFENLKTELSSQIFLSKDYCPEIYVNQLGDSAGLFGAMIYASETI